MDELPDEPRRTKLEGMPELQRLRAIDQELHVQAAERAGFNEAQAVAHAGEHMEERAHEEYRAPSNHGHPGTKTPKRRAEAEAEGTQGPPAPRREAREEQVIRSSPVLPPKAVAGLPPHDRPELGEVPVSHARKVAREQGGARE